MDSNHYLLVQSQVSLPLDDPKVFVVEDGVEPPLYEPKSYVLPLDDSTIYKTKNPVNLLTNWVNNVLLKFF